MDSYYAGEQSTTTGFMRMARQGLRMIDILSGELGATIREAFLKPPLLQLSAHAIVAVLNTLVSAHHLLSFDPRGHSQYLTLHLPVNIRRDAVEAFMQQAGTRSLEPY